MTNHPYTESRRAAGNGAAALRCRLSRGLAAVLVLLLGQVSQAATSLADQPLAANNSVPGNLSLSMSVEFPTAVSVAHQDVTYASASTYLGYFDPTKCYVYKFVDVESSATSMTHFAPKGVANTQTTGGVTTSLHTCTGINDYLWSGNFLNWASMQTIDPFRWAMTGGYRVVDIPSLTILEKAWASGQGTTNNFPDKQVTNVTDIVGATPFLGSGQWYSVIQGQGQKMQFAIDGTGGTGGFIGTYFNGTNLDYDTTPATPVLTRAEPIDFNWTGTSPKPGVVNTTNYSVRWVALGTAPSTGTYTFRTLSDDGVRLWVNGGVPVIDNWTLHGSTYNTASVTLTAGAPMNIRLEYYQATGGAVIQLQWTTPTNGTYSNYTAGTYPTLPVRVKVCDFNAPGTPNGLETNCQAYANGYYKPEGLMQQYAKKIRYSVFGYTSETNVLRDGGVLRAQQKFIAPMKPVPGSADVSNSASEWDATTGVQVVNPDAADATSTSTALGISITNSGALNYLNKFGELFPGNYRQFDPVSELFYASLRYYKNQGNVSSWSSMTSAPTFQTRALWADGFPIITNWADPIQYSCQKNFILGIGDVNTNADRNVPGSTSTGSEPALPNEVLLDTTVNAITATNKVGSLEGLPGSAGTNLGYTTDYPSGCCNNHSQLIAGLAYDANTKDIRPDLAGVQTVQTFWVDVLEWQVYWKYNQYYNAAKYGGLKVPAGTTFDPYTATSIPDSWWRTNTDTVGSGSSAQPRPDNYYTAGRPDQMVDGLTKAFQSIASQSSAAVASNAIPLPQVASGGGNISYSASWNSANWTGELAANELTYDAITGNPVLTNKWLLSTKLGAQLAGTGWDTNRRVITWNTTTKLGVPFRLTSLDTAQQNALTTPYTAGDTLTDYLNYLRGDRTNEGKLRTRASLLGDIVGAKPVVVGPPSLPLSDSSNPGYSAFKTAQVTRPTVVYVGSNDGMLHAVIGNLTSTDGGKELFAYVPGALYLGPTGSPTTTGLASLGNPSFTHHAFIDSAPNVYDIDMGNTAGGPTSTCTSWKSVLVGGLGKGGKAYYAIDVTDPVGMTTATDNAAAETKAAGKVMWEFTDSRLGYTYGQPAVVKTRQHGWVAIVPSGYNNADGQGYFFILNPCTGALIQALPTNVGSTSNDAGLAQINAFVLDRTDGTADAAYAGDLLGNVWRVDLTTASGAYPAPLRMATLADSGGTAQPVTSRPLIEVHPTTKRRYLLIGTGRLLDLSDSGSTQNQSYYAIIDGTNAQFNAPSTASTTPRLPSGIDFPITRSNLAANTNPKVGLVPPVDNITKVGWYLDVGSGWRDVMDSATFFGKVSFATTLPGSNACTTGTSRLYSVDFDSGKSELLDSSGIIDYLDPLGTITDLQNVSVSGQRQLSLGVDGRSDKNTVVTAKTAPIAPLPLRRLNWREVPIAN